MQTTLAISDRFDDYYEAEGGIPLIDDIQEDLDEIVLPHKYQGRVYQQPIWNAMFPAANEEACKRAVLVWHRRAGKDKTCINLIATKAMEEVGLYLYLLPTQTQARKVIWNGRGKDGVKFIDHFPDELVARKNNTEMLIELINGSIIQLSGSDNYDALMGSNPLGIVFSEYSLQDPNAWDYFRPILAENGGWAVFEYTPRGRNHGYFMYERAKKLARRKDSGWFVQKLSVNDTDAIPDEAIEEERESGMSDELIEQEFYCSFDAFNAGAYYGKQLKAAWAQERITFVPVEKELKVHTFWDLGIGDSNAIWFAQGVGKEVRLVHYYENHGESMDHYIKYVKDWAKENDVSLGEHWAPHDIKVREYTSGVKRIDAAKKQGFIFRLVPDVPLEDGIEAARALLPRCFFDERGTEQGLNCLTEYQKEYDEVNKTYKDRPKHNWTSHGADAFRYLAVAWKDRLFSKGRQEFNKPVTVKTDWSPFGAKDMQLLVFFVLQNCAPPTKRGGVFTAISGQSQLLLQLALYQHRNAGLGLQTIMQRPSIGQLFSLFWTYYLHFGTGPHTARHPGGLGFRPNPHV